MRLISDLDYLNTRSSKENSNAITYCSDPYNACNDSHAVAVVTEWDEFVTYDWKKIFKSVMKPAKVFDGRNILNVQELEKIGFKFYATGK